MNTIGVGSGSTSSITRNFRNSKRSAGLSALLRATIRWAITIASPPSPNGCASICESADRGSSSSAYLRCPSACSYSAYYSTLPYPRPRRASVCILNPNPYQARTIEAKQDLHFTSHLISFLYPGYTKLPSKVERGAQAVANGGVLKVRRSETGRNTH